MVPKMLVLGSAAEVLSTYSAQVPSTHRAAEVTSAHSAKMSTAQPAAEMAATAAPTRERIGRNASVCHRYSGSDDRDSEQHKFLHANFLSS
jgi:hypothetical protein